MPQATHNVTLAVSNNATWDFLKDYTNWAPLIPGYIAHEVLSDKQFTWIFLADLGFTKKTIKLDVKMTDLVESTDVKFDLKGLSDNFNGKGYFKIAGDTQVELIGSLELSADGIMGMMINSVLENFVPKATKELTESIQSKIDELHGVK
ncbi:SRPBCC family protein [Solibacillus sp. MA9]|uniref:SRPBCC family protein n=1 Tax=Solibacillus palustris TaxID=2908203 RepID=A0ABS9UDC3_9BACL|nr:SRPBCC family protein [Solibacillus sp. MA9]MCH7322347.1 SRPBCC family protein [Solibacillus sp. MA9]